MNSFFLLINSDLAVVSRSVLVLSEASQCWAEDSQHDVKFLTWSWEKHCSLSELSAASLFFSHGQLLFSVSSIFLPTCSAWIPVFGPTEKLNISPRRHPAERQSDSQCDSAAEQTGSHNKDLIHRRSNITWAGGQSSPAATKWWGTGRNCRLVDKRV